MKIKIARSAGFCMGVRRAVNLALDSAADHSSPVYTLGPLIHNPQVVDLLNSRGVKKTDEIPESGTVVIRSHGVAPHVMREIKNRGLNVFNGTCPRVARAQGIVKRYCRKGFLIVILGDPEHAEVKGIAGFSNDRAIIISGPGDVADLPDANKICLVSQTTQELEIFEETARLLLEKYSALDRKNIEIIDTICDSTGNRQREVRRLAKDVDAIVIVGGKSSANTRRLFEVAEEEKVPAFRVESEDELDRKALSNFKTVGLTAGASTPNWMIRRVYEELSNIGATSGVLKYPLCALRWAVLTNFHLALGAIALTYAAAIMQGFNPFGREFLVSMLYVFSIHTISMIVDSKALELNVPARARVFGGYRDHWLLAGFVSVIIGTVISFSMGARSGAFFIAVAGASFAYPVILYRGRKWRLPLRRLFDFPGSKDIFMALGWASVVAAMPWVNHPSRLATAPSTLTAFLMVFGLVFMRALLCDFRDIQADRLVGRETLPVALSIGKTKGILLLTLATLAALIVAVTLADFLPWLPSPRGLLLLIPLAYAGACVPLFSRQTIVQGFVSESIIDAVFLLAGIMAFLGNSGT